MSGSSPLATPNSLEAILHHCAQAAPQPWYPKTFAETTGTARDSLDAPLNKLRLAGLVRLTDWVQGSGQGYLLTDEGRRVLSNPRELARLRNGQLEPVRSPEPALDWPAPREPTTYERGEIVRQALEDSSNPRVTRALLLANLMVFAYGLLLASQQGDANKFLTSPPTKVLQQTGAVYGEAIVKGEWWRLLTCCFVHIGLLHLGVNMYSLWAVGPLLERMWGRVRYLLIYLLAGLAGSCAMVIYTPRSTGAGASGALWGLLGAMLAWIVLNRRSLPPPVFSTWLRQLIIVFILNAFISTMGNISAAAHFGGGAAGLVVGVFLNWHRFGRSPWRYLALLGLIAVPLVSIGAVIHARNSDRSPWSDWRDRRQLEQQLEQLRPQLEQWRADEANFREQVLPLSADARKSAQKADTAAAQLLQETPQGRSARQTKEVLAQLEAAQESLDQALAAAEAAGPYATEQVEAARQLVLQYLKARRTFCALAGQCLEERRPSIKEVPKAYQDYQEQWQQVGALAEPFERLLR